ncbi:hypothetical protein [Micromonospora sp. NPDC049497]
MPLSVLVRVVRSGATGVVTPRLSGRAAGAAARPVVRQGVTPTP